MIESIVGMVRLGVVVESVVARPLRGAVGTGVVVAEVVAVQIEGSVVASVQLTVVDSSVVAAVDGDFVLVGTVIIISDVLLNRYSSSIFFSRFASKSFNM